MRYWKFCFPISVIFVSPVFAEPLLTQPSGLDLASNFFVPLAGPPPHKQGPEDQFQLVLWQPNPFREDQKLVACKWSADEKTGLKIRDKRNQLCFQDRDESTTVQEEGDAVGVYLNPNDQKPSVDDGKMMITPSMRWSKEKAAHPFESENGAIHVEMDMQVPIADALVKSGSFSYVVADLELVDGKSNTKISFGDAIFSYKNDKIKDYPIGFDPPSNSVIINTPIVSGNKKITVLPGSAEFTGTPWLGWRHFKYKITRQNFAAALKALKERHPESNASVNPEDYRLTMFHLNAEINHKTARAELGWSMRGLKISIDN